MISKEKYHSEPLFVSLRGQMKEDDSWIIFDHYVINDDCLYLIGLTLDDVEKRVPIQEVLFSEESISYSITFLESKLNGMSQALNALKKIENEKEQQK